MSNTDVILPPVGNPDSQPGAATRWSLIRAAGDETSPGHADALQRVALQYWFPLYTYARRRGVLPEDARDLTQSFLGAFLGRNTIGSADPARGRFRTFLLTCFRNFLANQRERDGAARRGGGLEIVSLDATSAEGRYQLEPAHGIAPDQAFDRQWALETLDRALAAMREEYAAAGKRELHDGLRSLLWENAGAERYQDLAARLGMTEAAVKMAVVRLRRRCRMALLEEIACTVRRREDVEDEYRHLLDVLRG